MASQPTESEVHIHTTSQGSQSDPDHPSDCIPPLSPHSPLQNHTALPTLSHTLWNTPVSKTQYVVSLCFETFPQRVTCLFLISSQQLSPPKKTTFFITLFKMRVPIVVFIPDIIHLYVCLLSIHSH